MSLFMESLLLCYTIMMLPCKFVLYSIWYWSCLHVDLACVYNIIFATNIRL